MIAETLIRSNYVRSKILYSKIDPNATIRVETVMTCPKCSADLPLIDHGEKQTCNTCGLRMESYGNSLKCEMDE